MLKEFTGFDVDNIKQGDAVRFILKDKKDFVINGIVETITRTNLNLFSIKNKDVEKFEDKENIGFAGEILKIILNEWKDEHKDNASLCYVRHNYNEYDINIEDVINKRIEVCKLDEYK